MAFYDHSKEDRKKIVDSISKIVLAGIRNSDITGLTAFFNDEDTYIRKSAYLSLGRIYVLNKELQTEIIQVLDTLISMEEFRVRQSAINAAGEIGKADFNKVSYLFDRGLSDKHHSPRNAVIGSIKKMAEVNPVPVLSWAKKYLHHENKEIRREICHGIELRGRKYPQDILPLLRELQHDKTARVRDTLIHVIGQIAYKKGCLETVVKHLKEWENQELVIKALHEIIDVHERYKDFSALTQDEARQYISGHFPDIS